MTGALEYTYSPAAGGLKLWVFRAGSPEPSPAAVFYFGGAWAHGSPTQFAEQARYLASRGVTSVLVDYRVTRRHGSTVRDSLADAADAFAWVRSQAGQLNIDPARIAAAGGSAGGHLAAMLAGLPDPARRPDALLLFNPVLLLATAHTGLAHLNPPTVIASIEAWGLEAEELSPYHLLGPQSPPTLIMHGRADSVVPFAASEAYVRRALAMGASPAVLVGFDEQDHGFFNVGRSGGWPFVATMRRCDEFLAELGWLEGPPTLRIAVDGELKST